MQISECQNVFRFKHFFQTTFLVFFSFLVEFHQDMYWMKKNTPPYTICIAIASNNTFSLHSATILTHYHMFAYILLRNKGRFSKKKISENFENPLGIFVWEERVPFVRSSIRGRRERPGHLKDRKRYGTGDHKEKKSVNGTQIFHWKVCTKKTGLPFQKFHLFHKISSGTNQKVVFHLPPNRNFLNFLVEGKRSLSYNFPLLKDYLFIQKSQ